MTPPTPYSEKPKCDVCKKRRARYDVPIFKSYGQREWLRDEHWCGPCHDAIVADQPDEYIWKHVTDGWRRPSSKERSLLSWFRQ